MLLGRCADRDQIMIAIKKGRTNQLVLPSKEESKKTERRILCLLILTKSNHRAESGNNSDSRAKSISKTLNAATPKTSLGG